ncbi:Integral membrane protein 2B [Bagarius yarrelli]|uniref:Integral membrane protein 2 n=1 Tax=Bagarius yarrelli TaxID=175774 RepID=A0A556TTL9_BAGYA|nr:Integral membrane protein 2B [Bagarius yarrelli]
MVKVTFNSALAQKELKKEEKDEALIPQDGRYPTVVRGRGLKAQQHDEVKQLQIKHFRSDYQEILEHVLRVRQQSWAWCWCVCLGLALMLSGVVVGGAYLYKHYFMEMDDDVFWCGVTYNEEHFMVPDEEEISAPLRRLEERVRILETEQVELISVPVPEFRESEEKERRDAERQKCLSPGEKKKNEWREEKHTV